MLFVVYLLFFFKGDYNMTFYGDVGTLAAMCHYVSALVLYKILLKSVHYWISYDEYNCVFFWDTVYIYR